MRLDEDVLHEPYVNKGAASGLKLVALLFPLLAWITILIATSEQLISAATVTPPGASSPGMALITGIGLACLSTAMLGGRHRSKGIFRVLTWTALSIGVIVVASYTVTGEDIVSPMLIRRLLGTSGQVQVRCSIATALCIALLSLAQLRRSSATAAASDYLSGATVLVAGAVVLAYVFHVPDLRRVFVYSSMATPTALAIWLLGISSIVADPTRGWAALIVSAGEAGRTTRRHLLLSHTPILLVGLALHGIRSGRISTEAAMTFLVVLIMAPMMALIFKHGSAQELRGKTNRALERFRRETASATESKLGQQAAALRQESEIRREAEAGMYRTQRLEAVGHLTGGIAHDFNNLLMAMGTTLSLLDRQIFPGHPARPYIERLVATTERGAGLTKQLLVFSRTQTIDVRAVPLDPVIRGARELIGTALGPTIEIGVSLDTEDVWVRTDPDQLQLAILNMAINAKEAMPSGGQLHITSATVTKTIGGQLHEFARVRVADNGVGMSAEVAARAVEPFFTTKTAGNGTGLGLAQVYGVLKQSGGELRIDSKLGHGTAIDLLLLRTQPVPQKAEWVGSAAPHSPATSARALILLIDDDDEVRAAMAELFRCDGHQVIEASNGQAGLDLLQTIIPSVAVIDYLMPGLNGAQVALIARERLPTLPIVFVSGYADTLSLEGISGARVLRKPVNADALLALVGEFA